MAKGRMLNRSIAADDRLNSLSASAQRLWFFTLPHIDRDGLMDGRPAVLWAMAAPLQFDLMDITAQLINEWVNCGLVIRYNGDRTPVLFFPAFERNQAGMRYSKEAPSVFPPPPGFYRDKDGVRPYAVITPSLRRPLSDELEKTGPQHQHQDQDQTDHDGDECIPITSPTAIIESGGEMQEGGAATAATSAGELLTIYSDEELHVAAHQLGSLLALHMDWTNWDRWLAKQSPQTVVYLLEWIHYYRCLPDKALDKIESLPAVIRSNLTAGGRPPFTGKQRRDLAVEIEAALYAVREV